MTMITPATTSIDSSGNNVVKKKRKSGLSADRSYKLQRIWITYVQDGCSWGIHFKETQEKIREYIGVRVWDTPAWTKVSAEVRAYVLGYWEARRDEMYRHHAMWALSCDGKLMTNKEVDALTKKEEERLGIPNGYMERQQWESRYRIINGKDYRSPWSRIDGDKSMHVWKNKDGEPMYDRPFYKR